ncbi:BrnA antitoxin family protein [Mesorhizobium sp. BAC0120]|uniref:BrnA antitoxin family protein n=1 Tax=Mesorhizobium sp. BAC0120 TaxID=3090670 RepID=UPI00298D4A06|nr:BrnA antitoxin family protein [Mesorhizobium sp. BAC0120]MDW6024381.1 BrnA antitoxin family protein [Mesorhizobium sp. BAC0120]
MSEPNMRRASLAEIKRMKESGELHHSPNAPAGESLGPEFWAKAEIQGPKRPRSVHLKLDPDVFEYFYRESKGKGHLTRMQNVLRAYVDAHRHS